jgi:hypothetical protein
MGRSLTVAAALWDRTHPVVPFANLAGDTDLAAGVNGKSPLR